MKKWLLVITLFFSTALFAGPKEVLQDRLDYVSSFYAKFKQTVTLDGSVIQEGDGEFWLSRPTLFRWEVFSPDKQTIISDGTDIWMYTPDIEQVSVVGIEEALDNKLLLLLTNRQSSVWNEYTVTRNRDYFTLTPINKQDQTFILGVLATGMLTDFTVLESDGQKSYYNLFNQSLRKVYPGRFKFRAPENVMIDDQRNH